MSTTSSKRQVALQLPNPQDPAEFVALAVLFFSQFFEFQPKKGIRPMTKERIHKIAMISLAAFPVINSLYLE